MRFTFQVEVEVQRIQGKFSSRDDIEQQLQETLEGADPSSLEGENGGEYEVVAWEVSTGG